MYINGKKLNIRRFSSGELKFVRSVLDSYIENNRVRIIYENKYSLFELLLVLEYFKNKNVLIDLVLTYLPYQRMDHLNRDELDTVNYISKILNQMELNSLVICEPHCKIDNFNNASEFSYIKRLRDIIFKDMSFVDGIDAIVLTDKGGVKRYGHLAKNIVYFNKVRDLDSGLIVKHEIVGSVRDVSKVLIIDDIISTGDTIVNIIEELERLGIKQIYVLSGHIENNRYNKRIFEYCSVVKVYSTNSLKKKSFKKLELYDVKDLLKDDDL